MPCATSAKSWAVDCQWHRKTPDAVAGDSSAPVVLMKLYIYTVICQVVFHRRHGLRLSAGQISPPIVGELLLDTLPTPDSSKRADSRLVLLERCGSTYRAAAVLLDPVLVHLRAGSMVFRGIELEPQPTDGRRMAVAEHVQVWHCQPLAGSEPTVPGD